VTTSPGVWLGQSRRHWRSLLGLVLLTLAVYANSTHNGFVWDDEAIVLHPDNASLSILPELLGRSDSGDKQEQTPYYRPLTRATYVLDRQLFGLAAPGYHAVNLLLHLVCVLLLFAAGLQLSGAVLPALAAALLLALHPVNAETVNFISARNNLLATAFTLGALLAWLRGRDALCGGGFLLGLLAKETPLAFLPLAALWPPPATLCRAWLRERVLRLWPLLAAFGLYLLLRSQALHGLVGTGLELEQLGSRLGQLAYVVPRYLLLLVAPVRLQVFHELPGDLRPLLLPLLLAWVLLLITGYALWRSGRPQTRFGLLWIALNFLPISNLVPIPSAPMAERYLYLPAIGVWLIAADQFQALVSRVPVRARPVLLGCSLLVLMSFAALTIDRNADWRSDLTLFTREVAVDPRSARGFFNLCTSRIEAGQLPAAEAACSEAVRLDPLHGKALGQLGNLARARGRFPEAEAYYRRSLAAEPANPTIHYNLATLLEWQGHTAAALQQYRTQLALLPPETPEARQALQRIMALQARLQPDNP
jgi:hypothetical protein